MFLAPFKILLLAAALAFIALSAGPALRRLRAGNRFSGSGFKCETCRHARRIDRDGVLCGYGDRTVFKTPVHVNNCLDWGKKS